MLTGLLMLALKAAVSKLAPAAVAAAVEWIPILAKRWIPAKLIPAALAMGGILVTSLAKLLGVEIPFELVDVPSDSWMQVPATAWTGLLLGVSAAGLHQLVTKTKAWFQSAKAKAVEKPRGS